MAKFIGEFNVGDYVEYIGSDNPMGKFGTVVMVRDSCYLVEFDDFKDGHCGTGSGYQPKRYDACWNCEENELKIAYTDFGIDL
jgi:hypothetical protein